MATTPRKAHVKRVYKIEGEAPNEEINEDVWVDVLRIDDLPISFQGASEGVMGQISRYTFNWNDDKNNPKDGVDDSKADIQQENANGSRKTSRLKIRNPVSPDDDGQINTLWIVDRAKIKMPQGADSGTQGQVVQHTFNNASKYSDKDLDEDKIATRGVTVIKVVNNDLDGFDMQSSIGDPETVSSKIVPWDQYKLALQKGNKDDSQRLDVEVTDTFKISFRPRLDDPKLGLGQTAQIVKYSLTGNKEIEPNRDESLSPLLFELGDPNAKDANDDPSVIRTDPIQLIVNVGLESNDFVIYGNYGPTQPTTDPFLIYSKDGKKWFELPDEKLPPVTGSGLRALVYGAGAWLAISNKIYRSTDRFDTWKSVSDLPDDFPGVDGICWGRPKTKLTNPPLDANGKPINKGAFVAVGSDNSQVAIASSFDQGKTWTIDKVISTDEFAYGNGFVTFANGIFFVCYFGVNQDNGGFGNTFGPAVAGSCKIWTSENGKTWDGGSEIFSALTGLTWGSELQFEDPSIFYTELFPTGLVYRKKSKTYVLSGWFIGGSGGSAFYAESSSPTSFGGSTIGDQALVHSGIGQHFDPATGALINGGTNGEYYITNNPVYRVGGIAAVGDAFSIALQTWSLVEETVHFSYAYFGAPASRTDGHLTVSSEQEGVLSSGFSQKYFCGGTLISHNNAGTDFFGQPILWTSQYPEAFPASVAANSHKQPDAGPDSQGTFVWVRQFQWETFSNIGAPLTNRGMEVRMSSNGSSYSVVSTPITGGTVSGFLL